MNEATLRLAIQVTCLPFGRWSGTGALMDRETNLRLRQSPDATDRHHTQSAASAAKPKSIIAPRWLEMQVLSGISRRVRRSQAAAIAAPRLRRLGAPSSWPHHQFGTAFPLGPPGRPAAASPDPEERGRPHFSTPNPSG